MRARLGIVLAQQVVIIRAVKLNNKPKEMLAASSKGTVPILILCERESEGKVIDESLEIMLWALAKSDPLDLLKLNESSNTGPNERKAHPEILALINTNDNVFINHLEKYKFASRYHEISQLYYRVQCEKFIAQLEERLDVNRFLMGPEPCLADYAILPFIRQFARVDRKWYKQSPYPKLRDWLDSLLQTPLFTKTMALYPLWIDNKETYLFGDR